MNCNFTCGYGTIITIFALLALVLININNNFDIVYAQTTTTIPNFNIAAVGDWGCNSNAYKTVNSIKTKSRTYPGTRRLFLQMQKFSHKTTVGPNQQ